MARAHRHYIPGQVWHLTHRCHKREFLLKFLKDSKRTQSIAVGSRDYVSNIKEELSAFAKGRNIYGSGEGCHIREPVGGYNALFTPEKFDIGAENTCFWDTTLSIREVILVRPERSV